MYWVIILLQIAILFNFEQERRKRLRDDKRRDIATVTNLETMVKSIDHLSTELQIRLDCIDTTTKIQVNNSDKIIFELEKIKTCAMRMTEITQKSFMD